MKRILLLVFIIYGSGCAIKNNPSYYNTSLEFKDKYIDFVEDGEKVISTWYHYVITQDTQGRYIARYFFPETKVLISEKKYWDKKLTVQIGQSYEYYDEGNKKNEGLYIRNKREGEWKFYHRRDNKLSVIGKYQHDKEIGKWKLYYENGVIAKITNYKNGELEGEFVEYDTLGNEMNRGEYRADTIFKQSLVDTIDHKEILPYAIECEHERIKKRNKCTSRKIIKYFHKNLKYPDIALKYGIEGSALVKFNVDENGEVKDIDVVVGLCQSIKDELISLFTNMPKLAPGTKDGKRVSIKYTFPIKFERPYN